MEVKIGAPTKLRLGMRVFATDGPFGEVGDIVIDPNARVVTNLVVEPHNQHHQARLVPMWLVSVRANAIEVNLDLAHLRQLQRVSRTDFIKVGDRVQLDPQWDVGIEHVVASAHWDLDQELDGTEVGTLIGVTYDTIPKGDCEIRRRSEVRTADDHLVGHVEGFLADGDHLAGVLVKAQRRFAGHDVVLPISEVAHVRNDEIKLSLTRSQFRELPDAEPLAHLLDRSTVDKAQATARQLVSTAKARLSTLVGR